MLAATEGQGDLRTESGDIYIHFEILFCIEQSSVDSKLSMVEAT